MLTGSRSIGRSSVNTSMRSTSFTIRSASSQISRVSVRSSSLAIGFEQLRRAADARQRILDLVRQHGRERGDRARRAAMGELAVHLVGDGALLQHHDHVLADAPAAARRAGRPAVRRDCAGVERSTLYSLTAAPRARTCSTSASSGLPNGTRSRERMPAQHRQRRLEEGFGRGIGVGDPPVRRHHDDRMRQRVEHRVGGPRGQRGHGLQAAHAAACSGPENSSNAAISPMTHGARIVLREHALAMRLQARGGGAHRLGGGIERPAEMLARMAQPDRSRDARASRRRARSVCASCTASGGARSRRPVAR